MPDPQKAARWDALAAQYPDKPDAEITSMVEREFSATEPQAKGMSGGTSALLGAARGATMGFLPKIAAGIDATAGDLFRKPSDRRTYAQSLERANAVMDQSSREHPFITGAADFAGGMLVPGMGASKALAGGKQVSRLGRVARTAGIGAGTGAVAGVGYARGDAGDHVRGGLTGGVLGGVIGAAGSVAPQSLEWLNRRVLGRNPASHEARASEALKSMVRASDETPRTVMRQAREAESLGKPVILGDLFEEGQQGLEALGSLTGQEASRSRRMLRSRAEAAGPRIAADLEKAVGTPPAWAKGTVDEIVTRQAQEGNKLYSLAREHGAVTSPDVRRALDALHSGPRTGAVSRRAWDIARATAKEETGEDLPQIFRLVPDEAGGEMALKGVSEEIPTVMALDYYKRALDEVIGQESRQGSMSKELKKFLVRKKQSLLAAVDQEVPAYGEARRTFAGHAAAREAAETAQQAVRSGDARAFRQALQDAIDNETEATFKAVAQDELMRPMRAATREFGTTVPDKLNALTKGERMDMIRALTGGDDALEKAFKYEQKMEGSKQLSLGNSRTAARLNRQEAMGAPVEAGQIYGLASAGGGAGALASRAFAAGTMKALSKRGDEQSRRALAELLLAGHDNPMSIRQAMALSRNAPRRLRGMDARNDAITALLAGSLGAYGTDRDMMP